MEIREVIKEARIKSGLTQEQAAEELMVSRQTISHWENGKSLPDILSVIKMSDLYQISLDELLKGDQKLMEEIKKEYDFRENRRRITIEICIMLFFLIVFNVYDLILRLANGKLDFSDDYARGCIQLFAVIITLMLSFIAFYFAEKKKSKFLAKTPVLFTGIAAVYFMIALVKDGIKLYNEKGIIITIVNIIVGILLGILYVKFDNYFIHKQKEDEK